MSCWRVQSQTSFSFSITPPNVCSNGISRGLLLTNMSTRRSHARRPKIAPGSSCLTTILTSLLPLAFPPILHLLCLFTKCNWSQAQPSPGATRRTSDSPDNNPQSSSGPSTSTSLRLRSCLEPLSRTTNHPTARSVQRSEDSPRGYHELFSV